MIQTNFFIVSHYAVDRDLLRKTVEQTLTSMGIDHAQVDVSVVGKRKMQSLNEEKLSHEGVTDVLSFPQHEKNQVDDFPLPPEIPPQLGDVVICYPVAISQARRYGKRVDQQLAFYLQHGLMHLLGYHHD